jgi:hypothetical protein
MLMDFLVPQLKVSTLIIHHDEAAWGYGTCSQRNILIMIEWTWQTHSMAFQVFVLRALSIPKFE